MPNVVAILFGVEADKPIYNSTALQRDFDRQGIMVGVGSACNDADDQLSYVIEQLRRTNSLIPQYWNRNFVRISFDDNITRENINVLIEAFTKFKNGLM